MAKNTMDTKLLRKLEQKMQVVGESGSGIDASISVRSSFELIGR